MDMADEGKKKKKQQQKTKNISSLENRPRNKGDLKANICSVGGQAS